MGSFDQIDLFLADVTCGRRPGWPEDWATFEAHDELISRAVYHGITTLLLGRSEDWPADVREKLKGLAFRQASWELRHRSLLEKVIEALQLKGVDPLFLKGTALAYHVYSEPADRARGDTDLLVRPKDVEAARDVLAQIGFTVDVDDVAPQTGLQEAWRLHQDGLWHVVDLHWAAFNSEYLDQILTVDECFANSASLPRLNAGALRPSDPLLLMHVCIHRNLHRTAPYFSGGKANFGADRLIWAIDISRLTDRFSATEWDAFKALAYSKQVTRAMAEALEFATIAAGVNAPTGLIEELRNAGSDEALSIFLLNSGRRSRALTNFISAGGWRARLRHLRALSAPSDIALRNRYPDWYRAPRPLLLLRRMIDFALGR